eukprot:748712-Hanusia_phi.AAC.2
MEIARENVQATCCISMTTIRTGGSVCGTCCEKSTRIRCVCCLLECPVCERASTEFQGKKQTGRRWFRRQWSGFLPSLLVYLTMSSGRNLFNIPFKQASLPVEGDSDEFICRSCLSHCPGRREKMKMLGDFHRFLRSMSELHADVVDALDDKIRRGGDCGKLIGDERRLE